MDWYLDTPDAARSAALRREIGDHQRRHAAPGEAADDALLTVAELITTSST